MAALPGFEPELTVPKTVVLPLHHRAEKASHAFPIMSNATLAPEPTAIDT